MIKDGRLRLERYIQLCLQKEPDVSKLPTALLQAAYYQGATDNLSALCVPIPKEGLADDQGIIAWMLDGHGGKETSERCHQALPHLLKTNFSVSSDSVNHKSKERKERKTKKVSALKEPLNTLIDTLKKEISEHVLNKSLALSRGKKNASHPIQKLSKICLLDAATRLTHLNLTEARVLLKEYLELIPLFEQFSWFKANPFKQKFEKDCQKLEKKLKQSDIPLQNGGLFSLNEPPKEAETTSTSPEPPKTQ